MEPVSNLIIARMRGVPTEELLRECQQRVLVLAKDIGGGKVLYDALEMEAPTVDVVLSQRKLDEDVPEARSLKRAIVVPNTKLAYLARLAFGEGDYRVFYSDIAAAIQWLES